MITTELTFNKEKLKTYRDPIGYVYAKWFDEPFIVEVLNELGFKNYKFKQADAQDDYSHIDIYATNSIETITIDCKIMTHNFEYDNGSQNKKSNKSYTDIITISEPALMSQNTNYIMFVRRNQIHICSLRDIRDKVIPFNVRDKSKAIGGSIQKLYVYKVSDLIDMFSSYSIDIPKEKAELHEEATLRYERTRDVVRSIQFNKFLNEQQKTESKLREIEEFKNYIESIIRKYNSMYVEIPVINDTDALLNDIYSL